MWTILYTLLITSNALPIVQEVQNRGICKGAECGHETQGFALPVLSQLQSDFHQYLQNYPRENYDNEDSENNETANTSTDEIEDGDSDGGNYVHNDNIDTGNTPNADGGDSDGDSYAHNDS